MSATDRRPPYGVSSTANEFNTLKFTAGGGSKVNELTQYHWSGKYVTITAVGGDANYAFTRKSDAAINNAVAATDAGTLVQVGGILKDGVSQDVRLPYFSRDGSPPKLYFVRDSAATPVIYITLSDEPDNSA